MIHFHFNTDLTTHKTSSDHDGRYYTKSEINGLILTRPSIYSTTLDISVSDGIATIPYSSVSKALTDPVDFVADIFSSNDYVICRKWKSGSNFYLFIRKHNGDALTGTLTFTITAFQL